LSLNPAARQRTDGGDLKSLDILFAICIHAIILAIVLMLSLWNKSLEFHPQSVQISMISAQQLDKMMKRAQPPKPAAPAKPRVRKPAAKSVVKAKTAKPLLKAPQVKPRLAAKPAARKKPRRDPNFDPFKPMESTSDVTSTAPRINNKAAEVFAAQLSRQEINRYIALIQDAVQRHWKVPNAGSDVHDPLVEMLLNPGGSVKRVTILESSGNAALDASLIRAIEAAAPFQVPDKQFELFRNNRIRFRPIR